MRRRWRWACKRWKLRFWFCTSFDDQKPGVQTPTGTPGTTSVGFLRWRDLDSFTAALVEVDKALETGNVFWAEVGYKDVDREWDMKWRRLFVWRPETGWMTVNDSSRKVLRPE